MNYTDIINQVVAEAIDREVKSRLKEKDDETTSAVHVQQKAIDELRGELAAANAIVDTVKTLPTWKDQDLAEWKGSGTEAAILCLREFMLSVGASTAKGLENGLEKAQSASSRDNEVKSLQAELQGVRDALKKHVDSENSLRKDLEKANDRVCELDSAVDDKETEIELLNGAIEEKDELIRKYKDMADAISDWSTSDMPSLEPDDY